MVSVFISGYNSGLQAGVLEDSRVLVPAPLHHQLLAHLGHHLVPLLHLHGRVGGGGGDHLHALLLPVKEAGE